MAPKRRRTRTDALRSICKKRIEALEQSESLSTEAKFSLTEKQQLLEAYNRHGFQIFQDFKLLQEYIPDRRESDLKGLVARLQKPSERDEDNLDGWQKLCQSLASNYSRNRQVCLDNALSDALSLMVEERLLGDTNASQEHNDIDTSQPNYPELLKSFAQMLSGRCPDNMTPANAKVSQMLFRHINHLVDSLDLTSTNLSKLADGSWFGLASEERRNMQDMALKGLREFNRLEITVRDIEKNKNLELLCLEMPKLKRITEMVNPLNVSWSLLGN